MAYQHRSNQLKASMAKMASWRRALGGGVAAESACARQLSAWRSWKAAAKSSRRVAWQRHGAASAARHLAAPTARRLLAANYHGASSQHQRLASALKAGGGGISSRRNGMAKIMKWRNINIDE
jgi:hypothetical protein